MAVPDRRRRRDAGQPGHLDPRRGLGGRPGNDEIQLKLFRDYATNAPMYPALHDYLRTSRVPVLAVWGQGDPIFGPDGARAFGKDAPTPRSTFSTVATSCWRPRPKRSPDLMRDFLQRVNA